ncbi:hypothetical protein ACPPVO_43150 [Dactylosporangium sp. McL0621]|uniref:hypothetical protein n=1 Tax=Dactylosporangium sp. McL0621 TaxID=3415678 RepID=UPI003CF673E4
MGYYDALTKWWRSYPKWMRVAAMGLWLAAATLVQIGLVGDRRGWWTNQPFLLNLMSACATAAFGTPIAVMAFQSVTTMVRARDVRTRMDAAVAHLLSELSRFQRNTFSTPDVNLDDLAFPVPIVGDPEGHYRKFRAAARGAMGVETGKYYVSSTQVNADWNYIVRCWTSVWDFALELRLHPAEAGRLMDELIVMRHPERASTMAQCLNAFEFEPSVENAERLSKAAQQMSLGAGALWAFVLQVEQLAADS